MIPIPGSSCPRGNRSRGFGPSGDGPVPVIGAEIHRARLVAVALVLVLLVLAVLDPFSFTRTAGALGSNRLIPTMGRATLSPSASPSPTSPSGSLILTFQTPWVTPGQPFNIKLRAAPGGSRAANLGVAVTVYSCLTSVSNFDQAVTASSPPGTPISRTSSPLEWSGLHPTGGVADLSFEVDATGSASAIITPNHLVINVHSYGTSCQGGVYPIRLQLVNTTSGTSIASLTTFMVYVNRPAAQKLRFALVVPVSTPVGPVSNPTLAQLMDNPLAALARPTPTTLTAISQLVSAMSAGANATVPTTITTNAQTVQVLASGNHLATVSALALLSSTPAVHQFTSSPFAAVDAAELVNAGLGAELATQLTRGAQILAGNGINRSLSPSAPSESGPWITNDGLDDNSLAQLATAGYDQLILPSVDVSSPPMNGSGAKPFIVNPGHGSAITAITSNADLSSRFIDAPGDPVLATSQILGELAQIYFEYPNLQTTRAVVAVPPTGWTSDPSLISTVLTGLASNPIIEAVTAKGLFQALPSLDPCHSGCKLLSSSGSSGGSGLAANAIRNQRTRIAGFASSISPTSPLARTLPAQLGDLILASESEDLKSPQRTAVLRNSASAMNAQLGQISIPSDQTVTLTSRNGHVPISIDSKAPYAVTGTLTLTSDELLFANGTRRLSRPITLRTATNNFYINVVARSSGEFKLKITLRSPSGGVVITNGGINVRSTATSVVGVVLSLGAVAVLLVWWVRTGIRRRRRHRREEALELA